MTKFLVWGKDAATENIMKIEAEGPVEAAEIWAEFFDARSGEYGIAVGSKKVQIVVSPPDSKEAYLVEVHGELRSVYYGEYSGVYIREVGV
jgi:hypothetical protein